MKGRITGLTVIIVLLFGLILGQAMVRPGAPRERAQRLAGEPARHRGRPALPARRDPVVERRRARPVDPDPLVDVPVAAVVPVRVAHLRRGRLQLDPLRHRRDRVRVQRLRSSRTSSPRSARRPDQPGASRPTRSRSRSSVPLQQVAARALAGRDGAVVAIDPRNGAVLAMYSNPTYDPAPLTSTELSRSSDAAWKRVHTDDACTSRRSATSRPRRPSRRGRRSRS